MSKKEIEIAEKSLYKYADLVEYDSLNKALHIKDSDLGEISKKTILNIGKWALNGADNTEIAHNLEMTPSQFKTLLNLCPVAVYVLSQSREMANIIVTGSLLETALGGKIIRKQQLVKIHDYDEEGKVIGEHYEKMWVEEELPPNPKLLQYIAEHKLSEKFGSKSVGDDSEQHRKVLDSMDMEDIAELEKALNESNTNNR